MKAISLITGEQFDRYLAESEEIVDIVREFSMRRGFGLFSSALAGASLVRAINEVMGGDIKWWVDFISCGNVVEFVARIRVAVEETPNLPRGTGST